MYKILFSIALLFSAFTFQISAQTEIIVVYKDGREQSFSIQEQGKLYFSNSNLILEENALSSTSIQLSDIRKLSFPSGYNTHLSDYDINNQIIIYPNPVKDIITIAGNEENFNVKIYSLTGRIFYEGIVNNNDQINVSNLPLGLYILQSGLHTYKFCKY